MVLDTTRVPVGNLAQRTLSGRTGIGGGHQTDSQPASRPGQVQRHALHGCMAAAGGGAAQRGGAAATLRSRSYETYSCRILRGEQLYRDPTAYVLQLYIDLYSKGTYSRGRIRPRMQ